MTTVSCPSVILLLTAATALISSLYRIDKDPHEGKIVLPDIIEGYSEVNCVDK